MKYLVTHILSEQERTEYERKGLFCYDLRDSDFGKDIASIEKRVGVNRIGSMITDKEIKLGNTINDNWVDYNTFVSNNKEVSKIGELLSKTKTKEREVR